MKRVIPLLFTVFLFVISGVSAYSNDYAGLKEKVEADKSKIEKLLPPQGSMLKSVSGSKIKLQTIEGEWGRKVFTYNDEDQIVSYKYFKNDDYSNKEELTEQHNYEYNGAGSLVLYELFLLDSYYGWILIENEENSYYSDGKLKQSNLTSFDYDSGEIESTSRFDYEYSGNITRVNNYYQSGSDAEWESEGYLVYETNSEGLLIKTEIYELDDETGDIVLGAIYTMQYDDNGNETTSIVSSPDEGQMVDIFRTETEYNSDGTVAMEQSLMLLYDSPMLLDKTMYYYQGGKLIKMEEYSMNYFTQDTNLDWYIEYEYLQGKLASETYYQSDGLSDDFIVVSKKEFAFGDLIAFENLAVPEIEEYESFYEFDLYDLDYYENGLLTELTLYSNNYDGDGLLFVKTSTYIYSSETSQFSDNAKLSAIQIDGAVLVSFNADSFSYSVEIPADYIGIPVVTATAESDNATIVVMQANDLPGSATIEVTAEDGESVFVYQINFSIKEGLSSEAYCFGIEIDGTPLPNVDWDVFYYEFEYLYNVASYPLISGVNISDYASVVIEQAEEMPGDAYIIVTAEDGEATNTYHISFIEYYPSDNALLDVFEIDGELFGEFDPNVFEYTVDVSATAIVPVISAFPAHDKANVDIEQATDVPGVATITVTAEDGSSQVYTITFNEVSSMLENKLAEIKLFPNPVSQFLTIELNMNSAIQHMNIYSSNGKRIRSENRIYPKNNLVNVNVSNIETGLFFIELQFENGMRKTLKFTKI